MVQRMVKRGLLVAPVLAIVLAVVGDLSWAVSGLIGLGFTLANLWLAGRVIGGVAENAPHLLLPAALGAFTAGLLVLTLAAVGLKRVDYIDFPVTGITLVVSHLVLVAWEAAGTLLKLPDRSTSDNKELVHGA